MTTDWKSDPLQHEIDGRVYTSTKLPAVAGLTVLPKLIRILGEGMLAKLLSGSVGELAEGLTIDPDQEAAKLRESGADEAEVAKRYEAAKMLRERAGADVAYLVETVAERADRVGLDALAMSLLAEVQCNKLRPIGDGYVAKDRQVFDAHFAGEYIHLLKVLIFAIRHNFAGPTLGSLSMSGSRGTPKAGPVSTRGSSPETSTRSSAA